MEQLEFERRLLNKVHVDFAKSFALLLACKKARWLKGGKSDEIC